MSRSKFIDAFPLRYKLLLLVSLPLLLLMAYASFISYERFRDLASARDVMHLAQTTELLNIVHRLQFERGSAVNFVTSRKESSLVKWREAQSLSDSFAQQLPALKTQLVSDGTKQVVVGTLYKLQEELDLLHGIREKIIRDKEVSVEIATNSYSELIEKIHDSVSQLLKLAPGSKIFQLADALTAAAELKEVMGHKRALVTAVLNKGFATNLQIRELMSLTTKHAMLSKKFLKLAPLPYQETFLQLGLNESGVGNAKLVNEILESPAKTAVVGAIDQWFNQATQRIDGLREVEKSINQDLTNYAQKTRNEAYFSLTFTLVLAIGTVLCISYVAMLATGRLAEGFIKLRDSALEFTKRGEFKHVRIQSRDELGDVAHAFNQLIDQLIQISQAAEAVSRGDFTQHLTVKSEQDRLASSMNHMVATLQDSVEKLQGENWLKTGQSDLAEKINSDQNVKQLAHNAISFLAEYLSAPIAALYLVGDDEYVSLFASYAYAVQKEERNGFVKGESLIGQCVIERKMMVIENLPVDYVQIHSGLGSAPPQNLVVVPLIYAEKVIGVIELGLLEPLSDIKLSLLKNGADNLAVALHAALSRERLAELLEETKAQAEELKAQQQELELANAELEEQTQQLKHSKEELQGQKIQLTETNEALEEKSAELNKRNNEIEARSRELEKAHKALEAKAVELKAASKYKSEFLANMSHELRSPLNSLLILSQTLGENDARNLEDDQLEAISIIHSSGQSLLTLINDILDLSKVEAGKLTIEKESCDLRNITTVLKQQFLPLANQKGLELRVDIAHNCPESIYSDSQRLQQILRNLLSNAIKFTESGSVSLIISRTESNGIEFCVEDTGVGVPEKLQQAIFEAFQQADGSTRRTYAGTGLGLTISRELSRLLGGVIKLHSKENEGSKFTLCLSAVESIDDDCEPNIDSPFDSSKNSSLDTEKIQELTKEDCSLIEKKCVENVLENKKILVVDDDIRNTFALANLLKRHGVKVVLADNGKLALDKLDEYSDIEMAVMDIMMPEMDGYEAIRKIRQNLDYRDLPIIALTAKAMPEDRDKCMQVGANDYLAKPVDSNRLLSSLRLWATAS